MKKEIPEHLIIRIKEDKDIAMAARLEAEMTFMKIKTGAENIEVVYAYPELINTKEDLFLFAMTYGSYLNALNNGISEVSKQVKEMFARNYGEKGESMHLS